MPPDPTDHQRFIDAVTKQFDFLVSEFGFGSPDCSENHASQQIEYRGRAIRVSIVHERFTQLCIWITLVRADIGLDVLRIYELLGVVEPDAYEYEGALSADDDQLHKSLAQMARRLRKYGARVLEEDPTLIKTIESQHRG